MIAPSTWEAGKWVAWALLLLVPGSLLALALWWVCRFDAGQGLSPAPETERYLAEATDLADLERRMRVLERASGGPAFVTFNH